MMAALTRSLRLSRSATSTISPPISQAKAWGAQYKPTPSKPLLNVSQGAPASPPPPALLSALATSAGNGSTSTYIAPEGDRNLAEALAHEMRRIYAQPGEGEDGVDVKAEDIVISGGCNMAYVAAVMALCDPGDEVILPVPWYFNMQMSNNLLGVKSIPLPVMSTEGFQPSLERAKALITERTKAIVLVTPNNPTGATYPPHLIFSFLSLCQAHNIALILDETYRDFISSSSGPPHTLFSPSPNSSWRSNLIHLYSFSKAYHIPGHRLGALVAGPEVMDAAIKVLDCLQICASHPSQAALATPGLLPSLRGFVKEGGEALIRRHTVFRDALPADSGWKIGTQGAYYAFVMHPFKGRSAKEVCEKLAKEDGVIALPAEFFTAGYEDAGPVEMEEGWDRWVRISVANVEEEQIREVCGRLIGVKDKWGWEVDV